MNGVSEFCTGEQFLMGVCRQVLIKFGLILTVVHKQGCIKRYFPWGTL